MSGIEVFTDWLTGWLAVWMTDWLEILFWLFKLEVTGDFCWNAGMICVQDKSMVNFTNDPLLCQKEPTK